MLHVCQPFLTFESARMVSWVSVNSTPSTMGSYPGLELVGATTVQIINNDSNNNYQEKQHYIVYSQQHFQGSSPSKLGLVFHWLPRI